MNYERALQLWGASKLGYGDLSRVEIEFVTVNIDFEEYGEICRFMLAPRGAGKSTYLLRWLQQAPKETTRVIVYSTAFEAKSRYAEARHYLDLDVQDYQFISAENIDKLYGLRNVELAVDNVDMVLRVLLRHNIDIVTATEG